VSLGALVQMLLALVGAAVIAAAVQGFRIEWDAFFTKPISGVLPRILIYLLSFGFQTYNWIVNRMPDWEFPLLALLTAFAAAGIYHKMKGSQPAGTAS
jgi:hypothetical protein